jgi:hypothetical protein
MKRRFDRRGITVHGTASVLYEFRDSKCDWNLGFEVSRKHTIRHTHSVGLLWTSDQIFAQTATYTAHIQHTDHFLHSTHPTHTHHYLHSTQQTHTPLPTQHTSNTYTVTYTSHLQHMSRRLRPASKICRIAANFSLPYMGIDWCLAGERRWKVGASTLPSFPCKMSYVRWLTRVYVLPGKESWVGWASWGKRPRRLTTAAGAGRSRGLVM